MFRYCNNKLWQYWKKNSRKTLENILAENFRTFEVKLRNFQKIERKTNGKFQNKEKKFAEISKTLKKNFSENLKQFRFCNNNLWTIIQPQKTGLFSRLCCVQFFLQSVGDDFSAADDGLEAIQLETRLERHRGWKAYIEVLAGPMGSDYHR